MTIQLKNTGILFSDSTLQSTAAVVDPSWANITGRPGGGSSTTPTYWDKGLVTSDLGNTGQWWHAGTVVNCAGSSPIGVLGYYYKFYLSNTGTGTGSWDSIRQNVNCVDCNCNCNC